MPTASEPLDLSSINPAHFEIRTLDDEIRVDALCVRLLQAVRDRLVTERGCSPLEAGELCRGADYFLRDFIVAECHDNLLRLPPERVGQFAGHWYIVRNLEPNADELAALLAGIAACYRMLGETGLVPPPQAAAIVEACGDLPRYCRRIDDFWAIEGDGFTLWRDSWPLPARPSL